MYFAQPSFSVFEWCGSDPSRHKSSKTDNNIKLFSSGYIRFDSNSYYRVLQIKMGFIKQLYYDSINNMYNMEYGLSIMSEKTLSYFRHLSHEKTP